MCGIGIERFSADVEKCVYGSYGDSWDWGSACCNCAKKKGWTLQPCRECQKRANQKQSVIHAEMSTNPLSGVSQFIETSAK